MSTVKQALQSSPGNFDYLQAVQLAHLLLKDNKKPLNELLHFKANNSLAFSGTDLAQLDLESNAPNITTNMMTLSGTQGVLPAHYSELLLSLKRNKDHGFEKFLALFDNRTQHLLYDSWKKYRLAKQAEFNHDDEANNKGKAVAADKLFASLLGMFHKGMVKQSASSLRQLIGHSGLLSKRNLSASAIAKLVENHTGLPVKIEQFKGEWLDIPKDLRTRLPSDAKPLGTNCTLGRDTILGQRNWFVQGRFSVVISAKSQAELNTLRPDSENLRQLSSLLKLAAGDHQSFDIAVSSDINFLQPIGLGCEQHGRTLLGWNTLLSRDKDNPVDAGNRHIRINIG